jgi:hypothetical protein
MQECSGPPAACRAVALVAISAKKRKAIIVPYSARGGEIASIILWIEVVRPPPNPYPLDGGRRELHVVIIHMVRLALRRDHTTTVDGAAHRRTLAASRKPQWCGCRSRPITAT